MADGGGPPSIKFEKLMPRGGFAVLDSGLLVFVSLSEPEDFEAFSASFFSSRSLSFGVLVDFDRVRAGCDLSFWVEGGGETSLSSFGLGISLVSFVDFFGGAA